MFSILKEGDIVLIIAENREAIITHPEVFEARGLEYILLGNIYDKNKSFNLN